MWNGPVSCKDINRRNSYQQGLLEKAQERWTKLQNVSQQQPHAEGSTFYSSVEQSLPMKILKHFLNAWWCIHPGEKLGSLSFINRNRGPGDKRLCYRLSRKLEFGNATEPAPSLHTNITALDETSPQQTTKLPPAWKLLINKHRLWLVQPNHLALHFILVH